MLDNLNWIICHGFEGILDFKPFAVFRNQYASEKVYRNI